jgi:hypothetical protein
MPSAVKKAPANSVCRIAEGRPVNADIDDLSRTSKSHEFGVIQIREERMLRIACVQEHIEDGCGIFDRGQGVQVSNGDAS